MFLKCTSNKEIEEIIASMKSKSSCRIDGISSKLIKHISHIISIPLCHVFNLSFTCGITPRELKMSLVTPIYKTGDKTKVTNYRPISVLPCFGKILEKIMFKRLTSYITKHDILYDKQYGFRNKYSTSLAMIDLVDKISTAIENGEYTIGIFLDLSKAFDTVNHKILLTKLHHYGIRGICNDWFANYLTDRKQIVKYNVTYSTEKTIKCGVPQGTVLGPLLFLLYINDIHCSSNLSFILFADDTNLFRSEKDLKQLEIEINHELILVQTWLKDNQLTLNIKKTNYIIFKSFRKKLNRNLTFKINDKIIQNAKETKFLGIIIDEHLTWKSHIDYITKELLKVSNILCKVRHYLNNKHIITLYHTLVYPHLYYGNILWASNFKTRLKSVSTIQKKILKIISFLPYTFSSSTLFSTLEILKINKINAFQVGLFTFDAVKNTTTSI